MNDYISRQAAIDAVTDELDMIDHVPQWVFDRLKKRLKQLPTADVVQVETLKAEIYKLKCQQNCKNQDYYTGYMSALSTVEGILAEMGEE